MPGGVMVAQRFLVPFVKVRILAGQPIVKRVYQSIWFFAKAPFKVVLCAR